MIIKLALTGNAQPHQKSAVNKLEKSPGLIIYHGLGSGKTFTSLLAGERIKGSKLVVSPAALQGNYIKEMNKFQAKHPDYHIVSMETFRKHPRSFIIKYKPELLIADEIHRARTEGSVTQDALVKARPMFKKFLGLTGSPISNDPSDIAPLINLAAGQNIFKNTKTFHERYVKETNKKPGIVGRLIGVRPGVVSSPQHLDELKEKIAPFVHSFSGSEEYNKHIPKVTTETIYVPMDKEQERYYDFAMGKLPIWSKYKIKHNLPTNKSEAVKMNAFFSAARQISNSTSAFGGKEESPKLHRIVHDIEYGIKNDPNFKSVTHSNYLGSGLNDIAKILDKKKITYGWFTGEQDDATRNATIKSFNSGKIKHLLISPAGTEGLDLRGVKLHQEVDPNWNPEKTKQSIGRSVRYKSHDYLPENERQVLIRKYLAEPHKTLGTRIKGWFSKIPIHEMGVDSYINNRSNEKAQLNEPFLTMLKGIK